MASFIQLLIGAFAALVVSFSPAFAQVFRPPPRPAVPPLISKTYPNDANRDRIDDPLFNKLQKAQNGEKATGLNSQQTRADARARLDAMVEVELVFDDEITQKQIDGFLAQGGQITHVYAAVSYGWNGRLPLRKIAALTALMGPSLLLIEESLPARLHMD